jgi:PrtD family type I secretion system ABC transporter
MAAAFLIHPALGWVAVGGAGILLFLTSITHWATRSLLQASGSAGLTALQRVHADLRNADAIQAMGLIDALVGRWERENGRILALQATASDRLGGLSALSKFARLLIQVLAMAVGSWLAIEQQITGGMMIAASIMTARGLAPVEQVLAGWNGMAAARQAWIRVHRLLAESGAERTPLALPRPQGRLAVDKVMYAGGGDMVRQPILKGISFTVEPGESLGIIGPTAAGKSSLIRLLAGSLTPLSGSVRLDGAEIASWDRADIGRHIGYMPQDVQLLAGTVAENIARMAEPDPLLVVEAAQKAGVHELILQLAAGYETPIGEGGAQLSGGQRQRIALARALYGSPRLLLLDEPNSSLDAAGEEALMRALASAKQAGITVVLVSHRPNILQQVDRLAAIRDGILETLGPREEVMAQFRRPASVAPILRTVRAPS